MHTAAQQLNACGADGFALKLRDGDALRSQTQHHVRALAGLDDGAGLRALPHNLIYWQFAEDAVGNLHAQFAPRKDDLRIGGGHFHQIRHFHFTALNRDADRGDRGKAHRCNQNKSLQQQAGEAFWT